MLKADLKTSVRTLEKLFNKMLEEERVPEACKEGVIVKIHKEGDLSICDLSWY
jgi:hypothetical protein